MSDSSVNEGKGLNIKGNWGIMTSGIRDIWRLTQGEGVKVAVLDTGVEKGHPLLRGHLAHPDRMVDLTGSIYGARDIDGHGTHIIGTIASPYHNIGAAPGCRLYVAKVIDDDGTGKEEILAEGIHWALEQEVEIICISAMTKKDSLEVRNAIEIAEQKGCVVVCAVGNQGPRKGSVGYPARYPTTIGVGALDRELRPLMDTSMGEGLDIMVPGHDIHSTVLNGRSAGKSGSSMAAAFMTGLVALFIGKWKGRSSLTPDIIREQLWKTAIPLGGYGIYGHGMASAKEFIQTFNYKQTEKCQQQQED